VSGWTDALLGATPDATPGNVLTRESLERAMGFMRKQKPHPDYIVTSMAQIELARSHAEACGGGRRIARLPQGGLV
jgi:hypothetical protein